MHELVLTGIDADVRYIAAVGNEEDEIAGLQ